MGVVRICRQAKSKVNTTGGAGFCQFHQSASGSQLTRGGFASPKPCRHVLGGVCGDGIVVQSQPDWQQLCSWFNARDCAAFAARSLGNRSELHDVRASNTAVALQFSLVTVCGSKQLYPIYEVLIGTTIKGCAMGLKVCSISVLLHATSIAVHATKVNTFPIEASVLLFEFILSIRIVFNLLITIFGKNNTLRS